MLPSLYLLMIEDSEDDYLLLLHELQRGGLRAETKRVETEPELRRALTEKPWDLVLCDYNLPGFSGLAALEIIRQIDPDLPFIMISGIRGEEYAVETMRAGAGDYITKDNLARLAPAIEREIGARAERRGRQRADAALQVHNRRLRLLSTLAELLLAAETPVHAVSAAYRMFAEELDLHAYFNFLVQEDGSLHLDSWEGIPDHAARLVALPEPGKTVCGQVARTHEAIHVTDIQNSNDPRLELLRRHGLRAYFCNPLSAGGRLLGTLSFATRSRDRFTEDELELLRAIVRYIALADERLRVVRELRHSEKELKGRAAELETIINAIPDPVVICGERGELLRTNPAARHILGYRPEMNRLSIGERLLLLHVETADGMPYPAELAPLSRALAGETVTGALMIFHPQPNKALWASVSAAPLFAENSVSGAVAVFTDMTQLRQLQQEREIYIHTISHDLRTPLTVVLGHAELLGEICQEENLRTHVEAIVKGAERIDAMIEDLVESARMEGGDLHLDKEPILLDRFLPAFFEHASPAIDQTRIRLDIPPGMPPVVADPRRLERILTNLLTNALKYSASGTPVDVRVKEERNTILVSIRDRGQGIDSRDLPHIFQRFYRPRGERRGGSVGLGLYIAHSLVKAHGGCIGVESEPGVGSTFFFTLPKATAD